MKQFICSMLIVGLAGWSMMSMGCKNDARTGALIGAGVGAAAGAAIDHNNRGRGAAIGAGVGAGTGYIIGNERDKDAAEAAAADGG